MALTNKLCAPALIYLCFSLTQIIIDIFKTMYPVAFIKFWVMIIFTILLNTLCTKGLGIISWILVFIPFMLMSMITLILIIVFGLNPFTGEITYGKGNKRKKHNLPPNGYRPNNEWYGKGSKITPDEYKQNDCKTFCSGECSDACNKAGCCEKKSPEKHVGRHWPFTNPSNSGSICPSGCSIDNITSAQCDANVMEGAALVGQLCHAKCVNPKEGKGWCKEDHHCRAKQCVHKYKELSLCEAYCVRNNKRNSSGLHTCKTACAIDNKHYLNKGKDSTANSETES